MYAGLILRQDKAAWPRIISKPLLIHKTAMEGATSKKERSRLLATLAIPGIVKKVYDI